MPIRISTASRDAAVDAVVDLIDVGAGSNGTLEIRTGSQPATPGTADAGTLLVSIDLSATAYGAASSGEATLAGTPLSGTAAATGTAAHFRVKDADGDAVFDGDVGQGSGDLSLDNTSITSGQTVNITSLPVSLPMSSE